MPILHFTGKILPYDPSAFVLAIKDLPSVEWNDQFSGQTLKIATKIDQSIIDIEFEVQHFNENDDLSSLLMRAWDLARAAVDLYCFKVGWGLTVYIDKLIKPDGSVSTIRPEAPLVAGHATALDSTNPNVNNFDVCYRLMLVEPGLFMSMNDLIVSITLPHHASVNCARAIEGLRTLMVPGEPDRKKAWPIFQSNLNIERSYREPVTDTSTGPRHGDRTWIPGSVVNDIVERSWIIMNRFLEYRKGGNMPLPKSEFPLLS